MNDGMMNVYLMHGGHAFSPRFRRKACGGAGCKSAGGVPDAAAGERSSGGPRGRGDISSCANCGTSRSSVRVETFGRSEMEIYATWCGRALALSHARSGSSAMLSGYMGKSDAIDKAIGAFSMAYADQNEKDHAVLDRAVKKGTLKAEFEEDRE